MMQQRRLFGWTVGAVGIACLVALPAVAGPYSPRPTMGRAMKQASGARAIRSLSSGSGLSRASRGIGSLPSTRGLSGLSSSGLGRTGSSLGSLGNGANGAKILQSLGNVLNQQMGNRNDQGSYSGFPWGGYDHREDEMAKAYRDVGIANAMVGLVGVMVQASQANRANTCYSQPQGQWVRERVLITPAHYETKQVWIPELHDRRTGKKVGGGYYETRTEYVPDVYEERTVLVTTTSAPY